MKIWQKIISVVATFALLFNSLVAPLSVLAQTVDETPSPTPIASPEATTEATATPEATDSTSLTASPEAQPDATPAEILTSTPTPTDFASPEPTAEEGQPIETQAPESNPTVQGPPASTSLTASPEAQPTFAPEVPVETGTLSATILENTTVDTSALDAFDLSYQTDGSATVVTDKLDYSPYDTAIITGSGFIAGKTYELTVSSEDDPATSTTVNITASETGTIMYAYELDHTYRPNYSVVVKDLERVVAETTFTDSRTINSVKVDDTTSVTVLPGATINTAVTATTSGGSPTWRSTKYTIQNQSSHCVDTADHIASGQFTETFSITAPTTTGSYNLDVVAYSENGCTGNTGNYPLSGAIIVNDPSNPDTGWINPSSNSGAFSNASSAYADDSNTTTATSGEVHQYGYDLSSIPSGTTINGIEVRLDSWKHNGNGHTGSMSVEISWDSGATWTTTGYSTGLLPDSQTTYTRGGSTVNWGRNWTRSELNNFKIRLTAITNTDVYLDWVPVKIYYTVSTPPSDTTPPVITKEVSGTLGSNDWYKSNATVTWNVTDAQSAVVIDSGCRVQNFTTETTGTVSICTAHSTGGSSTDSVTVKIDTTKPIISLLGTSPIIVKYGSAYIDSGATASDNLSGDLTSSIVTVNPVDTSTLGDYTITYNVTDLAGNVATQVTRTVRVEKATSTTTVICSSGPFTYTGSPVEPCYVSVTGTSLNLIQTPNYSNNVNFGTATASYEYLGDTNHSGSSDSESFEITKADSTTTLTFEAGPYVYRGSSFTATANVKGAGGLNQSVGVVYSGNCVNVTSANGCTATATFAGDTNHNGSSDTKSITITKADANITVNGYTGTYDGNSHGATGTATGVGGTPLTGLTLGDSFTNVPGGIASWSFTNTNYADETGAVNIIIGKAGPIIVITPYGVTYDAAAHTATGTVKGVKTEDLAGLNLSGTTHTNAGDYLVDSWSFIDVTGNYSNPSGTVHNLINKAGSVTTVSCPVSVAFTGSPVEPCTALYSGIGGLSGSLTPAYLNNTDVEIATANASYAGGANHNGSSDSKTFEIIDYIHPTGSWVNPADGTTVSGVVPLELTAGDLGSGVKEVEFWFRKVGDTGDFTLIEKVTGEPYTTNWETRTLDLGDYTLRAIVTDKANNQIEKDITVGVSAIISAEDGYGNGHNTAIITWTTDKPTKSRVVYDTVQHPSLDLTDPNYGYAYSTGTYNIDPKVTSHTVTLDGLSAGATYYYRTISEGSPVAISGEHYLATLTYAGAPATSWDGGSVLGASTTFPLTTWPKLAYAGTGEAVEATEDVLGTETQASPAPEVVAAQDEAEKVGLIKWILTHKKISLGVTFAIIVIWYLLKKRKKSSS